MIFSNRNVFTSTEVLTPVTDVSHILVSKKRNGRLILGSSKKVSLFDVKTRKVTKDFDLKSPLACLASNFNDSFIATGAKNGSIVLVNTVTNYIGNPLSVPSSSQEITSLAYGRMSLLVSCSEDGNVSMWDTNNTKNPLLKTLKDHRAPASDVAFSPLNENLFLSCGLDKRCVCYDSQVRKSISEIVVSYPLTSVEVLPNGKQVVLGTTNGKILVYDLRKLNEPLTNFAAKKSPIRCLKVQPLDSEPRFSKMSKNGISATSSSDLNIESSVAMKENLISPRVKDLSHNSDKLNVSNQIISPLRGTEAWSAANSPALSLGSITAQNNMSHDSLFSPLRECSANGSPGPGSFRASSASSIGLPKTPVGSFNKSINTPLISPLTMIREEDVFPENIEDVEDEEEEAPPSVSKTDLVHGKGDVSTSETKVSEKASDNSEISRNVLNIPSIVSSFKSNNVVASTPFVPNDEIKKVPRLPTKTNVQPIPPPTLKPDLENESIGDIRSVLTAFPRVLQSRASDAVDMSILNSEKSEAGNQDFALAQNPQSSKKLTAFQQEYLSNCVEDAMDDFASELRQQMYCMQYDMIRSFQNQKEEIKELLRNYAVNEQLVKENERLKQENEELRKYF